MKILILTTEPIPLEAMPATGAGLRAWGLFQGLQSAGGLNVELGIAADAVRGKSPELPQDVSTFERSQLDDFIDSKSPNAIVFQHWGLMRELKRPHSEPIAVDLAGPHLLERLHWDSADPAADRREKIKALRRADFVVCSGEYQRHYFLPFLLEAGFPPEAGICPVIPFSVPPDPIRPRPKYDNRTIFYGGMFLPWQDPEFALRKTLETLEKQEKGKLVFVGGPHPSGDVSGGRFDRLQELLESHEMAEVHPVLPYHDLIKIMGKCGVALDLLPRNLERELAFPTRTMTAMWVGLPVIHNNYDEPARIIEEHKAGWTIDPANEQELVETIERIIQRPSETAQKRRNAKSLAKRYSWDKTIGPLAEWCREPRRLEKRVIFSVEDPPSKEEASPLRPQRADRPYSLKRRNPGRTVTPPPSRSHIWRDQLLPAVMFLVFLPISILLLLFFLTADLVRNWIFREG